MKKAYERKRPSIDLLESKTVSVFVSAEGSRRSQTCRDRLLKSGFLTRSARMWEKMAKLFFFFLILLQLWLCHRERERAGEHCQTKRVLSQHQSSFLSRQLGRATSPSLSPFSKGFSLLLTHMLSPLLPFPLSVHTCACSPSFSLQIWAIACYFLPSAFPLPSHELASFQRQTARKMILGKSVILDSRVLVFESVPVCELGKKNWHVWTFMPL